MKKKLFKNHLKKQKGAIFVFSLFIMISIFSLGAAFINIFMIYIGMNHVTEMIEEAARVRALAIDVPLKEQEGIYEVMHPYENYHNDNVINEITGGIHDFPPAVGHHPIYKPSPENTTDINGQKYNESVNHANYSAISSALDHLYNSTGKNVDGDMMFKVNRYSICFDIEPLPEGTNGDVTFSCTVRVDKDGNGSVEDFTITQTVNVSGIENKRNYWDYYDPNTGELLYHYQAKNVVFAATAFRYELFLWQAFENLDNKNILVKPPIKVLYSIAYPQIDRCYSYHCYEDEYSGLPPTP